MSADSKIIRQIEINGVLNTDIGLSSDEIESAFIEWIESNGWRFYGKITDITYDTE